jgi:transposase
MQKSYPSDVSREQFEKIRPILESSKQKTKPRKLDLYNVFCGVLYVLKSGCQWKMLPKGFPRWESVYYYFRVWSKKNGEEPSLLELVLKKISWRGPYQQWSERETSFCIIDSQSVKNLLKKRAMMQVKRFQE